MSKKINNITTGGEKMSEQIKTVLAVIGLFIVLPAANLLQHADSLWEYVLIVPVSFIGVAILGQLSKLCNK